MKTKKNLKQGMEISKFRKDKFARVAKLSLSSMLLLCIIFSPFYYFPTLSNSSSIFETLKRINIFNLRGYPDRFQFFDVKTSFAGQGLDLVRISELSASEFKGMILASTPDEIRKRLKNYIDWSLESAQKYQVDPFWVLAVMWTESHFRQNVKSYVNATGLMQIMPDTGHFLSIVMNQPVSRTVAMDRIKDPRVNIEMGVVYLERLLKNFNQNYAFATVAYNLGPARVQDRLDNSQAVGVRNSYLLKVQFYYNKITSNYVKFLASVPAPFYSTLAVEPNLLVPVQYKELHVPQLAGTWDIFAPIYLARFEKHLSKTSQIVSYL